MVQNPGTKRNLLPSCTAQLRRLASVELCPRTGFHTFHPLASVSPHLCLGEGISTKPLSLGGMYQRTWEHFVTKICFQFEDILKMFMVTCCTSVWNHFPKSLSEWTHFFLFCCWNVRSVGQPWLQALCGSSEPSTNLRNKHKRKDIPLGFLLMMCLKVISCFKVLLWMGTIAPCVQLYCLITQ